MPSSVPVDSLLLLCHSGGWDRLHQAASCAAAAAAAGWSVDLVFYHGALRKLLTDSLDELTFEPRDPAAERELAARVEELSTPTPSSLLESAGQMAAVRWMACSASCALLGFEVQQAESRVDAVVGWPTVFGLMQRSRQVLYL